jgi:transglutaminase-like putative cysteine protease
VALLTAYAIAVLAALDLMSAGYALAAAGTSLFASYFAYQWRRRNRGLVKIALTLGLLGVLTLYVIQVRVSFLDTRHPLIMLLVGVILLHCFDMPERKDLLFSILAGVMLIAVASTFAQTSSFFGLMAPALTMTALALYLDGMSREGVIVDTIVRARAPHLIRAFVVLFIGIVIAGGLVFAIIPRPRGAFYSGLPREMNSTVRPLADFRGEQVNPYYARASGAFPKVSGGSYFGAVQELDLNVRGKLSDRVIYLVKSTAPAYYRIAVFTKYDGRRWRQANLDPTQEQVFEQGQAVRQRDAVFVGYPARNELTIFNVRREVSNAIPSPWRPLFVYLPFQQYWIDSAQVMRAPFVIPKDTVFTIESSHFVDVEDAIRQARARFGSLEPRGASVLPVYLEVPKTVPERVRSLARRITEGIDDPWQKAEAIRAYLVRHYRYDLSIPYFPLDHDAIDYFLFEQKAGFCEHFASAFVILARASGVPARLVTGYAEGEFNPLTGNYEIRESDGHAWAEVFLYGVGWVEVEPTPGFESPSSVRSRSQNEELVRTFLAYLQRTGIVESVKHLARAAGAVAARVRTPLSIALGATFAALAIYLVALGLRALARSRARRPVSDLLKALARRGYTRKPSETMREFFARTPFGADAELFLYVYEAWAYGGRRTDSDVALLASALAQRVQEGERAPGQ